MKGPANEKDTMRVIRGAAARDITPKMADFIIDYLHEQFLIWDGEQPTPSTLEIFEIQRPTQLL